MNGMELMNAIRKAVEADPRPQKDIARAAKMNPVNLSQFKHGDALTIDSLCRLADVLGLTIRVEPKRKTK